MIKRKRSKLKRSYFSGKFMKGWNSKKEMRKEEQLNTVIKKNDKLNDLDDISLKKQMVNRLGRDAFEESIMTNGLIDGANPEDIFESDYVGIVTTLDGETIKITADDKEDFIIGWYDALAEYLRDDDDMDIFREDDYFEDSLDKMFLDRLNSDSIKEDTYNGYDDFVFGRRRYGSLLDDDRTNYSKFNRKVKPSTGYNYKPFDYNEYYLKNYSNKKVFDRFELKSDSDKKIIFPKEFSDLFWKIFRAADGKEIMFFGELIEGEDGKTFTVSGMNFPPQRNFGGFVETRDGEFEEWILNNIILKGKRIPLHVHTHPDFSAFSSSVDEKQIKQFIKDNEGNPYVIQLIVSNPLKGKYFIRWFDLVNNTYEKPEVEFTYEKYDIESEFPGIFEFSTSMRPKSELSEKSMIGPRLRDEFRQNHLDSLEKENYETQLSKKHSTTYFEEYMERDQKEIDELDEYYKRYYGKNN